MFNDNEFLNELHSTVLNRKGLIKHLNTGIQNSEFLINEIEPNVRIERAIIIIPGK